MNFGKTASPHNRWGSESVVPRRHKEAREKLDDLSEYIRATSVKLEKVVADGERDKFFTANEAKEYGLVDEVFQHQDKKGA